MAAPAIVRYKASMRRSDLILCRICQPRLHSRFINPLKLSSDTYKSIRKEWKLPALFVQAIHDRLPAASYIGRDSSETCELDLVRSSDGEDHLHVTVGADRGVHRPSSPEQPEVVLGILPCPYATRR